ncbi:MAG TPA: hypothetical protein VKT52_13130 [Ktedonobacterales bacterium]|nr:hypothetical protein [Ktedonobacterales bacterium]
MRAPNYCDTLSVRKALLDSFGGLPETVVQNNEWLYMLEEDTRNSLAVKRGKKLYSHPRLTLPNARKRQ